jgi:hypothetical protein
VNYLPCSEGFADVSKFHVTAAATGPKSCDCLPNETLDGQHSLRPYLDTSLPVELPPGQLPSPHQSLADSVKAMPPRASQPGTILLPLKTYFDTGPLTTLSR